MIEAYDQDHAVRYLDDRFDKRTTDADWIKAVTADLPKPAIITADGRIRRDPVERKVLAASGLTIFFFKSGFHNLDMHTQAVKLLTIWPQIANEATRAREPTAFEIAPAAKKVERICKTAELA